MPASDRRRIIVTGVTRGLGRALVDGFIARGHTLCGCSRSPAAIAQLRAKHGDGHAFDAVDVTHDREVARWAQKVLGGGPPDLLINNAAVINANAVLWEVPAEEFSRVIDANIKGVFHVLRHFVPAMVAAGQGVVVNISSTWGRSTSPEVAPYCATKFAVEGLSGALAQELPRGMAAVAVNPGVIHTEMLESCFGEQAAGYPEPAQWASSAVPFLLKLGPKDNGQSLSVP